MRTIKYISLFISLFYFPLGVMSQESNPVIENPGLLDVLKERTSNINNYIGEHGAKIETLDDIVQDVSPNGEEVPLRDPFNLSDGVDRFGTGNPAAPSSFLPNPNQLKVPAIKLKGVVNSKENSQDDLLALLEIGRNDVYMVRVGDEISYDPANPASAIKIVSISRLSVTVQVGSLGNVLVIR